MVPLGFIVGGQQEVAATGCNVRSIERSGYFVKTPSQKKRQKLYVRYLSRHPGASRSAASVRAASVVFR